MPSKISRLQQDRGTQS